LNFNTFYDTVTQEKNSMKWTVQEKRELRRQVRAGVASKEVRIENRSPASIHYQIYRLGLYIQRWKRPELAFLKKSIREGKKPWEINIPGRTKIAIRNKAIRARI
jgi:hypothetical protein